MSNGFDPAKAAAEYNRLWADNPLEAEEIQEIEHVIEHLDKLLSGSFMEDSLLLGARILLAHVIGKEE